MGIIIKSNSNLVNDMTALMNGLINDMKKGYKD